MSLPAKEIEKLIKESIPDATIEIKDLMGDNNHYSAIIKSKVFNNLLEVPNISKVVDDAGGVVQPFAFDAEKFQVFHEKN